MRVFIHFATLCSKDSSGGKASNGFQSEKPPPGLHKLTGLSLEPQGKEWECKVVKRQNQADKGMPNVQRSR